MSVTPEEIALVLSALGGGAVINSVVNALKDRKKVGADTVSVLTATARELVEPLRAELNAERAERAADHQRHIADLTAERAERTQDHARHIEELRQERAAVAHVRTELDGALSEARGLRSELADARQQLAEAYDEITELRARFGGT